MTGDATARSALLELARLCGLCTAEAVLALVAGHASPFIEFHSPEGQSRARLLASNSRDADILAQSKLEAPPPGSRFAIYVCDYLIEWNGQEKDALVLQAHELTERKLRFELAIPYTRSPNSFAVHRPKLLLCEGFPKSASEELFDAFWDGLDENEAGARAWDEYLDDRY